MIARLGAAGSWSIAEPRGPSRAPNEGLRGGLRVHDPVNPALTCGSDLSLPAASTGRGRQRCAATSSRRTVGSTQSSTRVSIRSPAASGAAGTRPGRTAPRPSDQRSCSPKRRGRRMELTRIATRTPVHRASIARGDVQEPLAHRLGGRRPELGDRLGVVVEREPRVGVPEEGLRGLHGLLALAFAASGVGKVFAPRKVASFKHGAWAQDWSPRALRSIGGLEVLGTAGLILPAVLDVAPRVGTSGCHRAGGGHGWCDHRACSSTRARQRHRDRGVVLAGSVRGVERFGPHSFGG
jgi:hypothetical protein